jgi:hypothetical protein
VRRKFVVQIATIWLRSCTASTTGAPPSIASDLPVLFRGRRSPDEGGAPRAGGAGCGRPAGEQLQVGRVAQPGVAGVAGQGASRSRCSRRPGPIGVAMFDRVRLRAPSVRRSRYVALLLGPPAGDEVPDDAERHEQLSAYAASLLERDRIPRDQRGVLHGCWPGRQPTSAMRSTMKFVLPAPPAKIVRLLSKSVVTARLASV